MTPFIQPAARRFLRNAQGGVAIIFGLTILPLLGIVGLAIDYGQIMVKRTIAQMAADASSLQATGVTREKLMKSTTATADGIAQGEEAGRAMFNAHMKKHGIAGVTPNVTVTVTGLAIAARTTFSVSNANSFGQMFGVSSFTASGDAKASGSLPPYLDITVAADVSASMGVAATPAEMDRLYNLTTTVNYQGGAQNAPGIVRCVFACHSVANWESPSYPVKPISTIAKERGITLRIDLLIDALEALSDRATLRAQGSTHLRIGLNTMGYDASGKMKEVRPLTSTYSDFKASAGALSMAPYTGVHTSFHNEALADFAGKQTLAGDGTAPDKPKKYLFIVTDGAISGRAASTLCKKNADAGNYTYFCKIDETTCTTLKNTKKFIIAIIYTRYYPIFHYPKMSSTDFEINYKNSLQSVGLATDIPPALQRCASPGWYQEATDDISGTLNKMLDQASISPTLTD